MTEGEYVQVYYNLHKKCYSVCNRKGRVIGYVDQITLGDVTFFVSEAGRQRVLKDQKKNVHAKVRGTILAPLSPDNLQEVTYNPYLHSSFVLASSGDSIHKASVAVLANKKAYV